jgi:hypothetical protein
VLFGNFNLLYRAIITSEDMAVDIEVKRLLESIGPKELAIGALFLVAVTILLQSVLAGPDLTHIPLAGAELSSRQRQKQYTKNSKALHRNAYKKVQHCRHYVQTPY